MVDIRDFFSKKPKAKTATSISSRPKKVSSSPVKAKRKLEPEVIELSDDEAVSVKDEPKAKKAKTEPSTSSVTTSSKHLPVKSELKVRREKTLFIPDDEEDEAMEDHKDDDDGDDEFIQIDDNYELIGDLDKLPKSRTSTRANTSNKSKPSSPAKPKSPAAKKTPSSSAKKATHTPTFSVHDILAKIPDAELPETSDSDPKPNFFALKQKQESVPQSSMSSIEIPEGQPNCLTGLTIVFTGVLPNLSREDCEALGQKYGAKITKSISGKTSLVVLGSEAGPSKVKKIKQHKIKAIDQDGFLQLIKGMPAEGGDSLEAEKARELKEREEAKAQEQAETLRLQDEVKEKERQKQMKKALSEGKVLKKEVLDSEKLWTVKYAPSKLEEICGNKASVNKLKDWLTNWNKDTTEFKAVLIHGPPGIGKTTAAHLVANSLGYDVLEKNASDVRSQSLLKDGIGNILNNTSVMGFINGNSDKNSNGNKFCFIMDEVDGMSGGDRGGVGCLAAFARTTSTPLILICNDKSLPKMRPFDRCTLEIPFRRPTAKDMKSRLMTIALRERIKLDPNVIDQLVQATGNDIRQIINLLSTVSMTSKTIGSDNSKDISKNWQKNVALKPFDITPRLFSGGNYLEKTALPLYKKMELYFDDHMFVPTMIQENYLNTQPMNARSSSAHLRAVANAADSISRGDLVDSKIHSGEQLWSLMPYHSIMSTILPASYVAGSCGRVNFTSWFGNNSKTGKYSRLLSDLYYKSRLRTGTTAQELRLQYVPLLVEKLLTPLLKSGVESLDEIIEILDYYFLTKEDYDTLMEYPLGRASTAAVLKKIPSKVKTAFTKKYNTSNHPVAGGKYTQSANAVKANKGTQKIAEEKKTKKSAADEDTDGIEVDPEEEAVM
ncbi:hypothetical protein WICPIJ_006718 [Wickerhamomyces pijperi]|uniref:Replication factor C subunit 1 n=1 Tax=Wickerhamomyces pijperi TaxID=599730 RepID=A0A9P8Q163_WICPI|nr:hypothetical protein WICPIJ_006718 [Wickerhamomyces pijperi]